MYLSVQHTTNYPEALLRAFATATLGAQRCSDDYLSALRVVLGNMSLADRIGVPLKLRIAVDFATPRTMRTLIHQLARAGFLHDDKWVGFRGHLHESKVYRGRMGTPLDGSDTYLRLQRRQEDVDFNRQMHALGIMEGDCPY